MTLPFDEPGVELLQSAIQHAKAVGVDGLEALAEHFTSEGELLSAAKLQWAIACGGALVDEGRMKAALALIDGLATEEAQQLVSVPPCCP